MKLFYHLKQIGFLCLVVILSLGQAVYAGQNCEYRPQQKTAFKKQLGNASKLYEMISLSGAQVLLIARTGQNLTDYNLTYSHVGFAYQKSPGRWEVVHKLNHCNSDIAEVYRQGLLDFLTDDLWNQQFAWMEPAPEVQENLLKILKNDAQIRQMDEPKYSMLAYAWSTKYQQSNQWFLETYALAAQPTTVFNRQQAMNWLKEAGYEPDGIEVGVIARNFAALSRDNISLDDHPAENLKQDVLYTVTADSIFAFIQNHQKGGVLNFTKFN